MYTKGDGPYEKGTRGQRNETIKEKRSRVEFIEATFLGDEWRSARRGGRGYKEEGVG